jgi:hypothetical protein
MRAVAAPMRRRGWFELARIDPPFVLAAAHATAAEDRGIDRPLLVTEDVIVPTELVVRGSTAPPSAADVLTPGTASPLGA